MTIRKHARQLVHSNAAWLLPALLACAGTAAATAQDYLFNTNNGSVTISRYVGAGGSVTVPAAVDGLPVTSIGDAAFGFSYGVTSITIPDSVTNIGELAFLSCTGLTNVVLSASVLDLGELACKNCVRLTTFAVDSNNPAFSTAGGVLFDKKQTTLVQYPPGRAGGSYAIPASVQSIASGAFYGCTSVTNLSLPAGLNNIGDTAFYGCVNLTDTPMPDGVTNVGAQAFWNCARLTQLTIPDSVNSLGLQAYYGCAGLTNVTIGNGLTAIADNTFTKCSSLLAVSIGNQVTSIGDYAFEYCPWLNRLTLGSSLTNIGQSAFAYCFDLPSVTLPASVEQIDSQAFFYCSRLSTISLPASVTEIGDRVFEFCGNLTSITVDPANSAYAGVNGVLFDLQRSRLVQYPVNNPRGSYAIPDGTVSVADTAFVSAYYLTSVTLPASLTNLETLAFYDCPEVTGFFFKGDAPTLGNNVFTLDDAATVYYLPATASWGASCGGLPTALWNPTVQTVAADPATVQAFGFTIAGSTNTPLVIEASTNLAGGVWTVIGNVVLTNGTCYFLDPQSTNYPGRYYRLRTP
jgi:hypothetical protein